MKLARFNTGQGAKLGCVLGDKIAPLSFSGSMIDLISGWDEYRNLADAAKTGTAVAIQDIELLNPIERAGKVWAIGLNYSEHIAESNVDAPEEQVWFSKAWTSLTGPYSPVQIPKVSQYVDYEAELVAIIGKPCKNVSATDAKDYVFGYCVGNDVTERMWQHRTPQWSLGKSFDTHGPIGPWITTADEITDPHALDLKCWVNGELRQSSNSEHLIFDIWQQIEHLSAAMTLHPGDVIFTGTPSGVGAAMNPRQFLKAGDVVRCEVSKLGHIENRFEPEV